MKNSFITGAAVLMAANAVSKILGAVFKIPLTYIVHEEGMAVYNTAFSVYIMFLSFITSGMPFAVQKLTAVAHSRSDEARAGLIVKIATVMLVASGAVGSLILWFGADFLALAMKEERAVWAIRALSPSVLLVAAATAVKSGFQGRSDMVPTAVSQVIEAIVKLCAGYIFAVWLSGYGTQLAAAGAAAGVSVGEFIASAILIVWYIAAFKPKKKCAAGKREIMGDLMAVAMPMMLMSVIGSFLSVCDTSLLRMSLLNAGLSSEEARFVYGSYTGYAMTVLNLPTGLLATLGISIIPIAAGAADKGNTERIKSVAKRGLGFSAAAGMLAFVMLFGFGREALQILFSNTNSADLLMTASPSVLFICIMQLTGAILQSTGHLFRSFLSALTAGILRMIVTVILASRPEFNIYGAAIGSDIGYFAGAVMNLVHLAVCAGLKREYLGIFIKPAAAAAVVLAVLGPVRNIFSGIEGVIGRTAVSVFITAIIFVLIMYILREKNKDSA